MILQQLINGITQGGLFAFLALSMALIYGALKLLNFAGGEVYMFGAVAGWLVVNYVVENIFLALLASFAMGWFLGFVIEKVAFKTLRGMPRMTSLLCTIGFSIFLKELANLVFGSEVQPMPSFFDEIALKFAGVQISWLQIFLIAVVAVILVALQFLIYRTKVGLAIRTVSLDFKTAGLMGMPVDRMISFAFSLAGSLGAIAGFLAGVYYNAVFASMGAVIGIKAFAAAVLGGLTSLTGAILGGYLLGIAENLGVQFLSSGYRDIISFLLLILFLLFRPRGILGKRISTTK